MTRVLITGANGFVGRPTVDYLLGRGLGVTTFSRNRPQHSATRQNLAHLAGDVRDESSLANALVGIDVVVHLAALKSDEPDTFDVNVEGARNLIKGCERGGVTRLVNISSQAATYARRGRYGDSKAMADQLFIASKLNVTTLIPSLVYGNDETGVFAKLLRYVERLPVVPIIGSGRSVFQPIHVEDLARTIGSCVEEIPPGPTYGVGGPDALTFDEMVDRLMEVSGLKKRKVHLPWQLCLSLARLFQLLPITPPLTVSNVLGASDRNIATLDVARTVRELGVEPRDFQTGLEQLILARTPEVGPAVGPASNCSPAPHE